jgi:hypothetical protein
MVCQFLKKFPAFLELDDLSSSSEDAINGPYVQPVECSLHLQILFLKDQFIVSYSCNSFLQLFWLIWTVFFIYRLRTFTKVSTFVCADFCLMVLIWYYFRLKFCMFLISSIRAMYPELQPFLDHSAI